MPGLINPASLVFGPAAMIAHGATSELFTSFMAPSFLLNKQHYWGKSPVNLPDLQSLIAAHQRGLLPSVKINDLTRLYGVNYNGGSFTFAAPLTGAAPQSDNGAYAHLWDRVAELGRPMPDPLNVIDLWKRGIVVDDTYEHLWERTGARKGNWRGFVDKYNFQLTTGDVLVAENRGLFQPGEFGKYLTRLGFASADDRRILDDLRFIIPGYSDLVHFAVREQFTPDLATKLGYYQEFPDGMVPWFKAQGMGKNFTIKDPDTGQDFAMSWPLMYWGAHWQPISPTQSYQMLHRLRPNRVDRFKPRGVNATPFTMTDVKRWLKVNDYTQSVRENLAAISYGVLRLVDIRNAFLRDIIGRAEVKEQLLDRGYVDGDAEIATRLFEATKAERVRTGTPGKLVKVVLDSYRIGTISRDGATQDLRAIGLAENQIRTELNTIEMLWVNQIAKQALARLKAAYMEGMYTVDELQVRMDDLGIQPARQRDYLIKWDTERDYTRKALSTEQIKAMLTKGLMTAQEGLRRLRNLGWQDPENLLWFGEVQQDIAKEQDRLRRRQAADDRRVAAEIDRARRRQEEERDDARRELAYYSPPTRMGQWFKRGLIEEGTVRDRLAFLGWPPEDVDRFLQQYRKEANGKGK